MRLWIFLMLAWLAVVGYFTFNAESSKGFGTALFNSSVAVFTWLVIFIIGMMVFEGIRKYRKSKELEDNKEIQEKATKYYKEAREEELEKASNDLEIRKIQNSLVSKFLNLFKSPK